MKPITRKEIFLAKIAGEDVTISPETYDEIFLNAIATKRGGGDIDLPLPNTREQAYLGKIAESITGGGGGGDSDFSIANVTFVNTYSGLVHLGGPVVFEENEIGEGAPALAFDLSNSPIMPNETVTRKIPLYKGSAGITSANNNFTFATTGDIEAGGPGLLLVTGSGTITITYVGD